MSVELNLRKIQQKIILAETKYNRSPNSVKLLAVSKGQSVENIKQAVSAGQKLFGENYLQEALPKIEALAKENLEWHFIGEIQSNKTRAIAENFHWVQSVARAKIAERLHEQRSVHLPPLNVCIEMNISEERSKAGVALTEVRELVLLIQQLSRLKLRGLMAIPAASDDFSEQRKMFRQLHEVYQSLQAEGYMLDTLSMGMSQDFVAAIAEGSTMVRIGTAIFGERN